MLELRLIRIRHCILVFLVGICVTKTPSFSLEFNTNSCIEKEGEAIRSIHPTCAEYYSHTYHGCCNWPGVYCSNLTDRVNRFVLSDFLFYCEDLPLKSNIVHLNHSLIALEDLVYLEIATSDLNFYPFHAILSGLSFYSVHANLSFIGSFPKLRDLIIGFNLSRDIPHQVGNLTKLQSLKIENSNMFARSLSMLSHLTSLRNLVLMNVDLSEATDWLQVVNNLPYLEHLELSECNIPDANPPYPSSIKGLCRLRYLDLSWNILKGDLSSIFQSLSCSNKSLMFLSLQSNNLTGSLPDFTKFHSLRELNLASNRLNGSFPSTFIRPSNLVELYLQENQLTGSVPDLSVFRSLKVLRLQDNRLNGTVHAGLGQLSRLEILDISSNSLKGEIGVSHLLNLSSLHHLDMSFNSLSFNVGSGWMPPFRLDTIGLAFCRLESRFPEWLRTQTNYVRLDMSYAGISGTIPSWFWNLSSSATFISLSHNKLRGELINSSTKIIRSSSSFSAIDLSSNLFEGSITPFFGDYDYLNLSRNSFSGSISFICKNIWILGLDLSHNFFSGKLPDCWSEFGSELSVLDLSNNNLSGKLPSSFGSLISLNSLHLRNNKFSGKIPSFFRNLTRLFYLDLGDNLFSGEIPKWMGHMLPNLTVLSLWNNLFSGSIPLELCLLSSIQILDLSTNNISGVIPNCLCSFAAMTQKVSPPVVIQDMNDTSVGSSYKDYISLALKGFIYEYKNHLELVKSIDLSSNLLGGSIPAEISCLTGLISLNLSGNNLIGPITVKIGQLKSLESLDLSNNHLSWQIPSTLSNLNFLGTLSLANNNLSGRIPTGTQIQSFDPSVFAGNPGLCGDPLPKKCIEGAKANGNNNHNPKNNDEDLFLGLCISIALGFISGFWLVCGVLIFKRSWRYAYFRFWIHLYDRLYVFIHLKLASIRRCYQA